MKDEKLNFGSRLLIGGIAGFVGTMAMTAAMRRLHRRLPEKESYPLTPREIVDGASTQLDAPLSDAGAKDITTAAHFLYGAAMGAIISAANPNPSKRSGALAGAAIWLASYMGWIPAVGNLKPAIEHPPRRNLLMLGVHLVWGAATAASMKELVKARGDIIAAGPDKDSAIVPPARPSTPAEPLNPPAG